MASTKTAIPIAYDDQGQGEPALLCMPGWCADRSAFEDLVRACSRTRRTLSLDWRGHGQSAPAEGDFGEAELIDDALAVIQESGVERVVPVALAHAGWVAIELRRRLGARIPAIVLVDWLVLDPPPPFLGALAALQDPEKWQSTRDQLFDMWAARSRESQGHPPGSGSNGLPRVRDVGSGRTCNRGAVQTAWLAAEGAG